MDSGLPFYIGIGKTIRRVKSKRSRNKYWRHIVNKYGYNVEILHTNISWEEACELEKEYIKQYGRSDLGLGPLVNMTDGGEGLTNITDELRKKVGQKKGFKHSEKSKLLISQNEKGEKHYRYGKKLDIEICNKISNTLKGRYCGEKNPSSSLTDDDIRFIREKYKPRDKNYSMNKLAKLFNTTQSNIDNILKRKTWKHI
jgi:hypothetical protein